MRRLEIVLLGAFLDVALEDKLKVIDVNARGPLIWSDVLGRRMVERGRGALVVVSSVAGFDGSTMVGTYAASKAFDTVLGEGLWEELGHQRFGNHFGCRFNRSMQQFPLV